MRYMLDTNICIYLIKKQPSSVLRKFSRIELGDISISSITFAELVYGAEKSQHPQKTKATLDLFVLPLTIMPFDDGAAIHFGQIKASLQKKGTPIGPFDMMIAAHARNLGVTLVTNNKKEFVRVPHLKIEDWV